MSFPVWLDVGPWRLHPHPVFESLAYSLGFLLYRILRRRSGDVIPGRDRWVVIAAAILGALFGSRLLFWLIDPIQTWDLRYDLQHVLGGKTIVGALLGGLMAVEWTKSVRGIRVATGDLFAFPLLVGMAIGRVGCFLTGVHDNPHGLETTMPWGVDFGDGVVRHPAQLYDIVFLLTLGAFLLVRRRHLDRAGDLFKAFLIAYLGYRFAVGFLKPRILWGGLSSIQWASLVAVLVYIRHIPRLFWERGGRAAVVEEGHVAS